MLPFQKTCKCINTYEYDNYIFIENHEYQVDIYPNSIYKIYNNGGYTDWININGEEKFNKYFKLII